MSSLSLSLSLSLSPPSQLATLTNKLLVISSSQVLSIMTQLAMVSLSNSLQSTSSSGEVIEKKLYMRKIIIIELSTDGCIMHSLFL